MKRSTRDFLLITGASGFIGGRIAEVFHEHGYRIRAQYRRPEPPEHLQILQEKGVELVRLDLTDERVLQKAVRGVDGIIHAAGIIEIGRASGRERV